MKTLKQMLPLLAASVLLHGLASATECQQDGWDFSVEAIPRQVIIVQDSRLAPPWKNTWDQARKLFRQQQYAQALDHYQQLLEQKDNLDQARWEYTALLMQQKQWQAAENELALLIAQWPQRAEYRLALAEIALGKCEFTTAAELFDALYRQHEQGRGYSNGKLSRILSGYITALEGLKQHERLQPLTEELALLLRSPAQAVP